MKKLNNKRFGRLVVIKEVDRESGAKRKLLCACDCGNQKVVSYSNLVYSHTKSCGCLDIERKTKHGMSNTRIYSIYKAVKSRCYYEKHKHYSYYGGRGIGMCDDWKQSFEKFYEWSIANGYADDLELDRIDNNGNYEPSNCQWITHAQNMASNKRRKAKNNTTGITGVYYTKNNNTYAARLESKGVRYNKSGFKTKEEAINYRKYLERRYLQK